MACSRNLDGAMVALNSYSNLMVQEEFEFIFVSNEGNSKLSICVRKYLHLVHRLQRNLKHWVMSSKNYCGYGFNKARKEIIKSTVLQRK